MQVRFDQVEYADVQAAAARCPGRGVSVSRFVAEAALSAACADHAARSRLGPASRAEAGSSRPGRGALTSVALAELSAAVAAVNRIGNNLNQLARERNITGDRPVGSRATEERALAALHRLADLAEALAPEGDDPVVNRVPAGRATAAGDEP